MSSISNVYFFVRLHMMFQFFFMIQFIKMAKQANIFKYFGNVTATRNVAKKEKAKEREINNSIQNLNCPNGF